MERCVKYLSAQPKDLDRILGMAGKKVNRLEVSVGKNPELRAFIKECEHILLRLHIRILIPMLSYFGYYNTLFN